MRRRLLPALQYSEGRSDVFSGAKLVNCYAQGSEGDKADAYMVQVIPGLTVGSDVSTQPVRGVHVMRDVLYAVIGTTLYSFDSDGNEAPLGTVGGSLPVMMADNGSQLAIQGGTNNDQGYILDTGTLYTDIVNLPQVSNVVYIDGYFLWSVFQSDQFVISALNDGLSYDPLDVATVEGDPDDIVGVVNDHRQIHFFGSRTVEIWYNSGAADFPFERQGNAFIERGCIDRNSIVKIDNSVHFVGNDKVIYRLNGYDPVRISTFAIEYKIGYVEWWRAFTYTLEGSKQYVLNTNTGTYAYDMATGGWHEKRSLGFSNYRISCAAELNNEIYFGGAYAGKIYRPSLDIYTEDGDEIPVEIVFPGIQTDRLKQTLYAFELYCETGVGNSLDPEPTVLMQYSKDSGRTWSAELPRTLGKVGEYLTRCIWRVGVSYRQLQIKVLMPSVTKRYAITAWADIN